MKNILRIKAKEKSGHHLYKDIWTPTLEEKIAANKEKNNPHSNFAVAEVRDNQLASHVPKDIFNLCA